MADIKLVRQVSEGLSELPILDPHTHLVGDHLGARGLHDVLLYHMLVSDLYGAGCPTGSRLTEYPGWPTKEEAHARIEEVLPFLPHIRGTSSWWMVRETLDGLYGWKEPITADNWRELDDLIRERADDRTWQLSILDRLNIKRTCTELARRESGASDDRLQYALEWAFFTRCQWGEFDTALYEVERCWGREPESPTAIGAGGRPPTDKMIKTLDDVHAAVQHYVTHIPYDQLLSTATHISTDIQYRVVDDGAMEKALANRANAGTEERDIYASYIQEVFLTELEKRADQIVYQFSFAAEPLPHETGSRIGQQTIAELGDMISRHPKLRFQCFLASVHANQSLCTMARELPNFSLAGFWWHNFFPTAMRHVLSERLDMVPVNKQIGFFSDAYCVEGCYGKALMVRAQAAQVFAEKIEQGQYTLDDALSIARSLVYETPQTLNGMEPKA
jgi:hypothetical protein